MRQILMGDLITLARVAYAHPRAERKSSIHAVLDQAHAADKLTKRTGRPHRVWGNGSLMAAAAPWPKAAEPFAGDLDYLDVFRETLAQVILWKRGLR